MKYRYIEYFLGVNKQDVIAEFKQLFTVNCVLRRCDPMLLYLQSSQAMNTLYHTLYCTFQLWSLVVVLCGVISPPFGLLLYCACFTFIVLAILLKILC